MLALLIPLEGYLFYRVLRILLPTWSWRESVLTTLVGLGAFIAIVTEILGAFHFLTALAVRSLWSTVVAITLTVLVVLQIRSGRPLFRASLPVAGAFEWTAFSVLSVYFLVTLFTALIAPPNTNDSLQYHLSRVMHWVVNHSVDFYATASDRQLWMPPLIEYAVLHIFLLSGGDRFVNLVQWFGMAGSIVAVSAIASQLGAGRSGQWMAAIFTATLPMGILQSTSTQTDYGAGLWSLCVIYYTLVLARQARSRPERPAARIPVMLGLSFSLAILTKGTIYAIVLPFFGYLLVTLVARRSWKLLIAAIAFGLVCSVGLNLPLWIRNNSTFASPLGPGVGSLGSSAWNPLLALSTALRDATNQLATPIGPGNKALYLLVQKVHQGLSLDLNDPRITLGEYRIRFSYHEDYAGNPVHFLIGSLSIFYLPVLFSSLQRLARGQKADRHDRRIAELLPVLKGASSYSLLIVLAYCVFSSLFKWQTTNSRLLLPWLLALGPLAGLAIDTLPFRFARYFLAFFLFLSGLPYLLSNPSRPLFDFYERESMLSVSRTDVQFYNSPEIQDELISVVEAARDINCGSIGLELDSSTPEYLIWYVLSATEQEVDQVGSINSIPEVDHLIDPAFRPCVVFCVDCGEAREKGYELVYNRGVLQLYTDPNR